jgi:hypothetical protein
MSHHQTFDMLEWVYESPSDMSQQRTYRGDFGLSVPNTGIMANGCKPVFTKSDFFLMTEAR